MTRTRVDSNRVEEALEEHLACLGLTPRPLRWTPEFASGSARRSAADDCREWWLARAHLRGAAQRSGWRSRQLAPGSRAGEDVAATRRVIALWEAVESAVRSGDATQSDGSLPPNPVAPWLLDAVAWSWAPRSAASRAAARWTRACAVFVDAYEAGLAFFRVLPDEIVAVPRPRLSVADWLLHDESGPAIVWADGQRHWFWRGVAVGRAAIEAPDTLTAADVHGERNLERRRILLERMGYARYVREARGTLVAQDRFGRLWRCASLPDEHEPLVLVEVENATLELDGSRCRSRAGWFW